MDRTEKGEIGQVLFVVILLLAAFTAVSTFVEGIDVAEVPEVFRPHWTLVASFFTSGLGAFLVAMAYNVYGYVTAYYRSGGTEEYDPHKLYMTLTKFAAAFTAVDVTIAELRLAFGELEIFWIVETAAKMIFVVVVALISEIKRLQTPTSTATPEIPTAG